MDHIKRVIFVTCSAMLVLGFVFLLSDRVYAEGSGNTYDLYWERNTTYYGDAVTVHNGLTVSSEVERICLYLMSSNGTVNMYECLSSPGSSAGVTGYEAARYAGNGSTAYRKDINMRYSFRNPWDPGLGTVIYVNPGSLDTSIPVFGNIEAAKNYLSTGIPDGQLNNPYLAPDEINVRLRNLKGNKVDFTWDGLTNGADKPITSPLPGMDTAVVDVYLGYSTLSGDFIEELDYYDVSGDPVCTVDANQIHLQPAVVYARESDRYISYIKFYPRIQASAGSGYQFIHGSPTTFYYDKNGNLDSVDFDWFLFRGNPVNSERRSRWYDKAFDWVNGFLNGGVDPLTQFYHAKGFDTGFPWLDALLTHLCDFINMILHPLYNISDFIFNKDGSGLYQILEKIAFYLKPANLTQLLQEALFLKSYNPALKLFSFLFLPDGDKLSARFDEFRAQLPFIDMFVDVIENVFSTLNGAGQTPPVIEIDLSRYAGRWSYGSTVVRIDFSWYAPYKPMMDVILSGFIWVGFCWRVFKRLPDIVRGAGMITDMVVDASSSDS